MNESDEIPYCIWYPDVANENTYRRLLRHYPHMKYQIGRACAVAGYTKLYHELNLLPEVHIAEEARDNGSVEIFEGIMSHKDKFDVMNDYTLSIRSTEEPMAPTFLNGDTAVRSSLDVRREREQDKYRVLMSSSDIYFNITADFALMLLTMCLRL